MSRKTKIKEYINMILWLPIGLVVLPFIIVTAMSYSISETLKDLIYRFRLGRFQKKTDALKAYEESLIMSYDTEI
mgnify:FL=1